MKPRNREEMQMSPDVDHIAIANNDLSKGRAFYEKVLGLDFHEIEEVPTQKVRAAILTAGAVRIELLEPTAEDSPIARFIEKRGEGLHHIAFQVPDLEAKLKELEAAGVRLIDREPRPGAGGTRIAFLHPAAGSGVLIELVERPQ